MATVQTITAAKQGIYTMEAYGMVNSNLAGLAAAVLGTIEAAADIDAAIDTQIAKWEMELAATADWGYQNRVEYTLNTLKGLK